jgi:hypothetical protein
MLSEALTSLIEVKTRLQSRLSQQAEYRALQILERTISQLADILAPRDELFVHEPVEDRGADGPVAAPAFVETAGPAPNGAQAGDRLTDSTLAIADALNEISSVVDGPLSAIAPFSFVAPAYEPPNGPPDIEPREDRPAEGALNGFAAVAIARLPRAATLRVAAPFLEPSHPAPDDAPREDRLADMALPIAVMADEASGPTASASLADISGMAALYDWARDASGITALEERVAEAPNAAAAVAGGTREAAPNSVHPGNRAVEAPAPVAAGLAAALYESTGDALDAAHPEDRLAFAPPSRRPAPTNPSTLRTLSIASSKNPRKNPHPSPRRPRRETIRPSSRRAALRRAATDRAVPRLHRTPRERRYSAACGRSSLQSRASCSPCASESARRGLRRDSQLERRSR